MRGDILIIVASDGGREEGGDDHSNTEKRRGYNIRRLHPGLVKLTILCKTRPQDNNLDWTCGYFRISNKRIRFDGRTAGVFLWRRNTKYVLIFCGVQFLLPVNVGC